MKKYFNQDKLVVVFFVSRGDEVPARNEKKRKSIKTEMKGAYTTFNTGPCWRVTAFLLAACLASR
jgi:hypothetical protein